MPVSYKKEIQYDVIVIDIDKSMSLAVVYNTMHVCAYLHYHTARKSRSPILTKNE